MPSSIRTQNLCPTRQTQYEDLGEAVLTAWEQGRLRNLISDLSAVDTLSESEILQILIEAEVLTDLNIAEAVRTKILTIGGLKVRIEKHELELAVRDYISESPWLISPKWQTYRVEKGVTKLLDDSANKAGMIGVDWAGRIDLALASGDHLLVVEFMRPGLKVDWDHIERFERYVRILRERVRANTAGPFKKVTGYVVAGQLEKDGAIADKIESMANDEMFAMDWQTLLSNALVAWQQFLDAIRTRAPQDERLKVLL